MTKPTALAADYLQDVLRVGPEKPLGYLPLCTIRDLCRVSLRTVVARARKSGNLPVVFDERACHVFSGALYVYNHAALAALLSAHVPVLRRYRWPSSPPDFVARVASETVSRRAAPDLYRLIGMAFADECAACR